MTSQAVERTRIRTGGYWPLRGECVKINYILEQNIVEISVITYDLYSVKFLQVSSS